MVFKLDKSGFVKRSELNKINQELDYIESVVSDDQIQFTDLEQYHASNDLEKIIEQLEMAYKQRTSEKVIQLF